MSAGLYSTQQIGFVVNVGSTTRGIASMLIQRSSNVITKTCLYNFDPFKPHFYIVKLGFIGVYITFFISALKHGLLVLVRTASSRRFLRIHTIHVLNRNMKNIRIFYLKIFIVLVVKFSVYLNRHVFVMVRLQDCLLYITHLKLF